MESEKQHFRHILLFYYRKGKNAVQARKNYGSFIFDWYRKPTFSEGFLNFNSNHPMAQKKGTIFSLVDRAFLLSDFRFHTQNLTFIINILLDNDYPLTFVFNIVNQRIKNLIKNRHITHKVLADNVCTNESAS
ncbi:hypothetical protein ALC56_14107 [Trachymyrmex septentrionalis]|uniref:Uncharacterized protein n=1 Tax=Trachymyrmex septentrionalis TaxID=34720 RepID=A0A195EUQ2_9HYME|nr:hypothetical protein ALC56_14107 [Trachymyrmex septentrionalis]